MFVVAYVLIATERVHRVAAALGGAAIMLLIGATDAEHAFFSDRGRHRLERHLPAARHDAHRRGAASAPALFEYLAIWAAKRARGRPFPVMVILVVITAVASAGAGQRHHGAAGRAGDAAGLRPARACRRCRS